KRNDLEVREENVPLFIVSLQLAKSSAVQYTRTLLTLLASGRPPAQMFLAGLQRKAAANPIKQARPMERWELDLVGDFSTLENDRVALRPAWATAGRWGEIALLQKENSIPHLQTKEALIVDWGALPKTFKIDPQRAARYVVIGGEGAKRGEASPKEWRRGKGSQR
ncbi:trans-sialidase, partial [Trypanosoma grayi]|uniref:trans-sialidase n=1 Tax=Trypanosoma grayi TaxID=71804 RepID=UPI0004F497CE